VTPDPVELGKLGNLEERFKASVLIKISTAAQIDAALNRLYQDSSSIDRIISHLSQKHQAQKLERQRKDAVPLTSTTTGKEEFSIENLVNTFIEKAMQDRASDIHLDPTEKKVRVRNRIDGVLHELYSYPAEIHSTVVSRLKVLAQLDISEKRHPQDGSFQHSRGAITLDIRTSTLPTVYGEKVVLRLLDKEKMKSSLGSIGMSPQMEKEVLQLLQRPYGIIFMTGPTGSGKTTTLYSMLNLIDGTENNIITVEDPVEYKFDVINQVQVNEKAGLNFSSLLRSILRQDPDVVMVGEVRDQETADLAVRAALTGHLVLTTIHTNDSVSTPTRLIDMKIEPFLLASGLTAVLAQRLVRVLCTHCKQAVVVTQEDADLIDSPLIQAGNKVYGPKGCAHCLNTGYLNRIALFELITVNDQIRRMISDHYSEIELKKHLLENGFTTMRQDGINKVLAGVTSLDEVLKATL
jgi:type IV pilus assembly protein PilB